MTQKVREILNMLKWHPEYEFDEVSVVFIDRPKGVSEFGGRNIVDIGHKFIYLRDDVMIPIHRIVEIKYRGETFWRKVDEKGSGKKQTW